MLAHVGMIGDVRPITGLFAGVADVVVVDVNVVPDRPVAGSTVGGRSVELDEDLFGKNDSNTEEDRV